MQRCWFDNGRGKQKYSECNLSQCHFVHPKSHNKWSSIEPRPQRCRYIYIYLYIALCSMWEGRKLHNEDLNDLYCSPTIVRAIKSRRMSWAEHVVRMGERRGVYRVLVGKPEGKRPFGRPRRRWVDKLWWIFRKGGVGVRTGSSWLRIGTGGGQL
jgi:hypothetical protein